MSKTITASLPLCDEWGTPVEKMPDCPVCGEDELGMLFVSVAYCYACGITVIRKEGLQKLVKP